MANLDHFNGAITANSQTIGPWDTVSCTGAYILVSGTYAGVSIVIEGTVDGATTWVPLAGYQINATSSSGLTTFTPGTNGQAQYYILVGACQQIRVRSTAWTSGTMNVAGLETLDADPIALPNSAGTAVSNFSAAAGTSDGSGGPTTTSVYADEMLFNGATWDRSRANFQLALDGSSARTASGNSAAMTNYNARGAIFYVNVTAASGTTPTFVWKVQWSYDGGTTYVDLDATNAATASITTTGTAKLVVYPGVATATNAGLNSPLPRHFRTAWVIGGTTPSFTFASYAQFIN